MPQPRSRSTKTHLSSSPSSRGKPGSTSRTQKQTILLVDDDPAVLDSLRRVLASEGWHVITAKSGTQGFERLQEQEPDLLITDLRMANVNGWDLLFHENLQRPNLPIFVITALPLEATLGAEQFATKFFQKPLDLEGLLSAVRRQLDRKRSLNEDVS